MNDRFEFTLNGKTVVVQGEPANRPLLDYLRASGLTGSKQGCAEGDCGACSVAIVDVDTRGARTLRAVNSCITLLPMIAGREVVTVEGIAGRGGDGALHPVQAAMVERYGSQCGYCTPGFVVSMFEAYYRRDPTDAAGDARGRIGDQLNGNLCRCTGYRPIRDAMLDALDQKAERAALGMHEGRDLFQLRLAKGAPMPVAPALDYEAAATRFLRPTSLTELYAIKAEHRETAELV